MFEHLANGWQVCATDPGQAVDPGALAVADSAWIPASVPGTVADALRAAGQWTWDGPPRRFDGSDWWYRCRFLAATTDGPAVLCLDGLATVADVWLNGRAVLHSENMFVAHEVDVTAALRRGSSNELCIRFKALDPLLAIRRPRPRWRAPMVEHQQLRWFRTTLLGRTPGWSPPAAPVGPWRDIRLEYRSRPSLAGINLRPRVSGTDGTLELTATLQPAAAGTVDGASATVAGPDGIHTQPLRTQRQSDGTVLLTGTVVVPQVALWWPHSHGDQPLYRVSVAVDAATGPIDLPAGRVGFRTVDLHRPTPDDPSFGIAVNGVPIFCRGACWTPLDVVTLSSPRAAYHEALQMVRDAGMNMLRVGGPLVYECADFHELCDELGILVWQDFMFANMDYPEGDSDWTASALREVTQTLERLRAHPSLALLCGDSEGEQQAAMWGAPRADWNRPVFRSEFPALCARTCPDVPYWPSSASGGDFPHQVDVGTSSYYGVGAYRRSMDDARRSNVRFASECLGFANIPDERTLSLVSPDGTALRVHQPAWKARVPRDLGAGWDFDDIRDHYLRLLFGVDPLELRATDHERYLALGRVVTGEVMAAAFAEWRRPGSTCRGALVYFLRDLWPGAGWGVVDATGWPKAAYHYLRRILAPVTVFFSDEGLNGVSVHVVNDTAAPIAARLRLALYGRGETTVAHVETPVQVAPRGGITLTAAALLDGFVDITRAYRFGPPAHELTVATLLSATGETLGEAFHFPAGLPAQREADVGMEAEAVASVDGGYALTVRSRRFAQAIAIDAGDLRPSDNYFHLAPGGTRTIRLHATRTDPPVRGSLRALNSETSTRIRVRPS